jgi:hypothetical protein
MNKYSTQAFHLDLTTFNNIHITRHDNCNYSYKDLPVQHNTFIINIRFGNAIKGIGPMSYAEPPRPHSYSCLNDAKVQDSLF